MTQFSRSVNECMAPFSYTYTEMSLAPLFVASISIQLAHLNTRNYLVCPFDFYYLFQVKSVFASKPGHRRLSVTPDNHLLSDLQASSIRSFNTTQDSKLDTDSRVDLPGFEVQASHDNGRFQKSPACPACPPQQRTHRSQSLHH